MSCTNKHKCINLMFLSHTKKKKGRNNNGYRQARIRNNH